MEDKLIRANNLLQALHITSTYDNLTKLAAAQELIDTVIGELRDMKNQTMEAVEPIPEPEEEGVG